MTGLSPDTSWSTVTGADVTVPPPTPRPEQSLAAMDAEIQAAAPTREVSSERIACPRKWVEITLLTEAGEPIVGASCTLEVPGGNGTSATTGSAGIANFEGVSIDPATATLSVQATETDGTTTYIVRVVPIVAAEQSTVDDDAATTDEDEPAYFQVPWALE